MPNKIEQDSETECPTTPTIISPATVTHNEVIPDSDPEYYPLSLHAISTPIPPVTPSKCHQSGDAIHFFPETQSWRTPTR
ncbi:hypothetical protein K435DRAFT_392049 [Dendrothele bispora CBS 962.96]|uniref:Uncharacterized protein n=1 Tax=Dendrothele bispora (strain CBS 962.96) TaxID=1314807 RepID=A0A4S8L9C4_DENBC|nr:hypothetical protein K435DRAFT_392049 [Dendrothele bispora CBS 962.96]